MAKLGKLLKKAAKKKAGSKSKSKTPEVDRPDLNEAIDKWTEGSKMEKDGKALKAQAEGVILPEAEEERVKVSGDDGSYHSSVKINGKITVSVQSRYTTIDTDHEEKIREVVGDKYDEFFKEDTKVSLKPSLLEDEDAMGKIIDAVGEENFERFFDVKQSIVPTRAFHEQRSTNKEIREMFEELNDEGIVKPYKAAVKRA
jgi:hypothetical protein